jgi:hypothetical protein
MKKHQVKFTAYEVTESNGYTSSHVAYFEKEEDARMCAELQKGYRYVKVVTVSKSWTVYESYDEYDPVLKAQRKEEVLAKLTTEEKELLGLL